MSVLTRRVATISSSCSRRVEGRCGGSTSSPLPVGSLARTLNWSNRDKGACFSMSHPSLLALSSSFRHGVRRWNRLLSWVKEGGLTEGRARCRIDGGRAPAALMSVSPSVVLAFSETPVKPDEFILITGPIAFVQNILQIIHEYTQLPWWALIVLSILTMRMALLTLYIPQTRNAAILEMITPETKPLRAIQWNAMKSKDSVALTRCNKELNIIYRRHNVNPWRNFLTLGIWLPINSILFRAYWGMIESISSFKTEGPLSSWGLDLSLTDPYHVLPMVIFCLMNVNLLMGTPRYIYLPKLHKVIYFISFLGNIGMIYFTWNAPFAVLLYSTTTIIITTIQLILFTKVRSVMLFFKIPTMSLDKKRFKKPPK